MGSLTNGKTKNSSKWEIRQLNMLADLNTSLCVMMPKCVYNDKFSGMVYQFQCVQGVQFG
jgi:hypothetical protein